MPTSSCDAEPGASIHAALEAVLARIARAAERAGRRAEDVTLVAVSKTHPVQDVLAAVGCGQLVFGENRVQEAQAKFPDLRAAHPGLRLHLIGGLQTNKAEEAVRVADMIETLDRPRLAHALTAAAERTGRSPDMLVQVNIGDETQKSGVPRGEADSFIADCQARFGEQLRGLMCIPPADRDPVPFFGDLARLRDAYRLPILSMGMSGDFEAAIACGATHVRVGSAIFGARPRPIGA